MSEKIVIDLILDESTAWALAQFVKRVGWQEFINNAVDEAEARRIRAGISALQRALDRQGYAPR